MHNGHILLYDRHHRAALCPFLLLFNLHESSRLLVPHTQLMPRQCASFSSAQVEVQALRSTVI